MFKFRINITMTSKLVAIYSNTFLPNDSEKWSASPSAALLTDIHKGGIDSARWIARIQGASGEIRIALGDPVAGGVRNKDLYVPSWLLSTIGVEGIGEEILVRFERCEEMVKATKLCFKYLGELPSYIDMKELLEHPLSQLGVLSQGQILPAPVLEGSLVVSHCEPEGVPVFLDGNEIAFDIEGDRVENTIPVSLPEAAPVPESTSTFSGMLPPNLLMPTSNPTSNGRYQTPTTSSRGRFANKSSFVPFSGEGRKLG